MTNLEDLVRTSLDRAAGESTQAPPDPTALLERARRAAADRRRAGLGVVAAAVVLLIPFGVFAANRTPQESSPPAIAAPQEGASTAEGGQVTGIVPATEEALLAKQYESLAALRADSAAVVVFTPSSSMNRAVAGAPGLSVPETVTTGAVHECIWGDCPGSLAIVQVGDASMDTSEMGRLLQRGEKYLLFVRPAARDAEYVLTGTATSYRWSGTAYQRVDDIRAGSPRLPAVVTLEDLLALSH